MSSANGTTVNGTSPELPDSKSPSLALAHPTTEEYTDITTSNAASWRGALPIVSYLRREKALAQTSFTKDGGITFWALIDTAAEDRTVLASCESLRHKALVLQHGKVQDVICHGICSVWCKPEMRKRGYAARMIQELGDKLGSWQADERDVMFTVLFSDIGKVAKPEHLH